MSSPVLNRSAKDLVRAPALPFALVAACVVINIGVGQLVRNVLHWPIYLDSIGTILAGALGGPLIGLITGGASNLIWGVVFRDPQIMPYAITAACIGIAAGLAAHFSAFRNPWRAGFAGLITGVMAALVSAPIASYVLHGRTGGGSGEVLQRLSDTGASVMEAATLQGLLSDPVDKAISFLIVWLILLLLPPWLKSRLGRAESALGRWRFNSRYGVAAVLSAVAAAFSWFFLPAFNGNVYAVFYLAVILSALNGGLGPALLAMTVGVAAQIGFQVGVPGSGLGVADLLRLVIFVMVSFQIAFITSRLEAALALQRRRQAEIRSVVDNVVEALMLLSPDGHVIRVNRRFEEMFSVGTSEVVGKTLDELHPVAERAFQDPGPVEEAIRNTTGNQPDRLSNTFAQVWPQERQLELFATPVVSDGNTLGRLYGFRDVTHERELDRMKTEFVSQVSHELRTPLTSIKGFTDLLLDEDTAELDEEQEEYLGIVRSNVDRLVALINDLLDISRIESGRIKLKIETIDLGAVIHEVVVAMRPLLDGKRQSLSVEVPPDLPPARADHDRVVQILTNLVSNAHKYTQEEGAIEVVAGELDGQLQVKVGDNGMGIAPEDVPRLFSRFFRVDNSLTRQIGGTGLGLSIVKSIVEMQGGKVAVETAPGQGSTFSFTLPRSEQPAEEPAGEAAPAAPAPIPAAPAPAAPAEPAAQASVLVVDENHDDAEQLVQLLGRASYTAEAAGGVDAALERIRTKRPELITVGVRVPGLTGFDAARRLASDPVSQDIPLLLLSFHDLVIGDQPAGPTMDETETLRNVRQVLGTSPHRRVLVIEDDESIRRLLAVTLQGSGIEALEAPDGESGLELASREQPSLVLLDLRLPGIDGLAVLERLKRAPETARIPVIAMTGSQGLLLGARARVMALGAADFVSKPFEMDSLVDEIRALVGAKEIDRADTSARH